MLQLEALLLEDSWKEDSSCKYRRELFFSRGPLALFEARRLCAECPVYDECLSWATGNYSDIEYGIFAGFNTEQRHAMAKRDAPYVDWRVTFHPEKPCAVHREEQITFVAKNRRGDKYYICLDCGTRIKRLGRNDS